MTLYQRGIPQVVEATADGTGLGKTFSITRLRYHYERHGVPATVIRIESRGIMQRSQREGDIFIATEEFAQARRRVGGLAGVLQPAFARIAEAAGKNEAVLIDWAGGQAQNRLEVMAATGFHERLAELKVRGASLVVTTNVVARMREAAENLAETARVAPGLKRMLLLNERLGEFVFAPHSAAQKAYEEMLAAAKGAVIRLPEIGGDAWPLCEANGLTLPRVVRAEPGELAELLGESAFIAKVVINEVAAWWLASEKELQRAFPFPKPAKK